MQKTIFYNARITTMDPALPKACALLAEDGIIRAVYADDSWQQAADAETSLVDLQGAALYPGLTDSHLHILNWAVTSHELVLQDCASKQAMLDKIAAYALRFPEGTILDGRGFNEDLWPEKSLPTRQELDAVCPRHGLRLTRVCGHMMLGNSYLLRQMGITKDSPVPFGGSMDWDKGIFCENAEDMICPPGEPKTVEMCKAFLYEGMCHAAQSGLCAIYSDDIGTYGYDMHTVIRAYRELDREGKMPVRVVLQCALPTDALFDEFLNAGYRYGQTTGRFTIGPRKLYIDGSLGARTALLSVPYADDASAKGVPIYTQEELNHHARRSHEAGMPFIVHAIGDLGAEMVLNAVEYARSTVPGTDSLLDGIVHCQITTPHTLQRIADLGVQVFAQPVFCEYDLHICKDRVGAELEKTSYNWKSLLDAGVCISSGSDCPVETLEPVKNIFCAVNRRDFDLQPASPWLPDQCLTADEAVYCHTVQAARSVEWQKISGKIAPGFRADFTLLDQPIDGVNPEEILHINPVETWLDGKKVNEKAEA